MRPTEAAVKDRSRPVRSIDHRPGRAPDYDVVVVGSRVAGASTAMLLARLGHRVLMVDRVAMPSDVVSTHAILRTGVLQLSRWGVLDEVISAGTPPVRDITLGFGEERIRFQVRPECNVDTFYAPRRYLLDSILIGAAQRAGVEMAEKTRMVRMLSGPDGEVTGIVAERGGTEISIGARMVVGADGVWSRTAKLVGARSYRSHIATNSVSYAYYSGIDASDFWFQFTPGVNAGIIPTNDGLCCVFASRREDDAIGFEELIEQAGPDLADRVRAGTRETGFRTGSLPGFMRQPWGPGWALVGDAGYTKDPISAHGISDALRDAELCARAVDIALRDPEHGVDAMNEYQRVRDELSLPMFRESEALARYEWDPAEASQRMRGISEAVRVECELLVGLGEWSPQLARV